MVAGPAQWRLQQTDPVILPLHGSAASEDARARLSPPDRKQTAVNVMSLGNLDNTGPRRQTSSTIRCELAPNIDPALARSINHLGRRSAFGPHAE